MMAGRALRRRYRAAASWRPTGAQVLGAAFAAGFLSAVVAQGIMTNLVLWLAP